MDFIQAKEKLAASGQTHLLTWYDTLTEHEQEALLEQIADLDLTLLDVFADYLNQGETERGSLAPLGALTLDEITENYEKFDTAGLDAIRQGKVGAVLLAGGMGTRLGCDKPKGMYDIGINKPLYIFECLVRNLLEVVDRAGAYIPLFIMTSERNDEETRAFFKEMNYFGYNAEYVHFFIQELAPAVDMQGNILLEEKGRIAVSPNGNGGWFSSMIKAGLLPLLKREGIEWLNVFAVDNVLQKIADPVFVGATILSGASCGSKVVSKSAPDERVGVLCLEDGTPSIVEYYEMTEEMLNRREPDGRLSYNYGVILNYLFRTDHLERIAGSSLPIHVVKKKIPYIDENGTLISPDTENGCKFETLVLDMIHMQDKCLSFEVDRQREFAPIKNAEGVDSVDSARELLRLNGAEL